MIREGRVQSIPSKNVKVKYIQWDPMSPVTNEPQQSGHVNMVAVLKGFFKSIKMTD